MAGGIRKSKGGFSDPAIITDSFESQDKEVLYCPECRKDPYGLKKRLYPRLDYDASDKDLWLQCTKSCGKIFGINQLKKESKLESFAVPSSNQFDENRSIVMGLENKRKLTRRQRHLENLKERIAKEKDPEIREALRRGSIVTIIEDSMSNY